MTGEKPLGSMFLAVGAADLVIFQRTTTRTDAGTKEGDEGPGLIGLINGEAGPGFEDGGSRKQGKRGRG